RIDLFEHLKKHNLTIEKEVLLEKAQKFLDRIIFIAFCEDIGLLPNDLLHKAIEAGKHSFSTDDETIWSQIKGVFSSIDKGNPQHNINAYNGGLFKKDDILDSLKIKNNFFNKIDKLSAYDFDSDVDVNILGHIFEQSISDIEDIKANIRNEDYDKNESKRKKDGIYYTPPYITKFIIEEAIGKYLQEIKDKLGYNNLPEIEENRSPQLRGKYIKKHIEFYNKYEEKLSNIKILDPACGSGAFLNQAFDYLLIEYQWIHKQISLIKEGQTSIFGIKSLHRDILKNNLFGVDLNAESVEITKLSLWLKTANKNKPLTNLDDNIKCGNSLINDTFIVGDKAFLWEQEFPEVINEGGFDIVIGNPPYVRQEEIKWMKDFLKKNYKIYDGKADLYTYFFEKGIELLKDNGYFSIIVSNKFTRAKYGEMLRKYLLNQSIISYIDFTGKKIFKDAEVDSCIITIKKAKPSNNHIFKFDNDQSIKQSQLNTERWSFLSLEELSIKNKVEKIGVPLYEWDININNGIKTGYNEAFIIDEETKDMLISKDEKNSKVIKPMLRGEDISRYSINFNNLYILATGYDIDIPHDYPVIYTYLKEHKERAEKRYDQGKNWWNLRACSYYDDLDKNKIIWPDISNIPSFYLDTQGYWLRTTSYFMIGSELEYINALLNSKLIDYIYKRFYSGGSLGKGTRYKKDFLLQVPMVKAEKNIKSNIKDYVSLMYKFKTKLETLNKIRFINVVNKYASIENNISIFDIVNQSGYKYEVYSGRAQKIRNFTVNINDNIITIYTDKSGNEKYELVKFEVDNYNKRQYIKVYLENLSEDKLEDINNRYSGNILEKLIQIKIPDYTVDHVVEKVINEWEKINNEINLLYKEVEQIDRKLNKIIYQLYELTEDEIKIVKNSN
ncbi:MAG: Eco57I restriction-modification methylase domain-containing protein, partial [bacterium]